MTIQPEIIIAYIAGLAILFFVGYLLLTPLKFLLKLLLNGVLGGVLLWVLNLLGSAISVSIAINPLTALIAGFLGVPGVVLLLLLQVILV